jgi:hypothetical protein
VQDAPTLPRIVIPSGVTDTLAQLVDQLVAQAAQSAPGGRNAQLARVWFALLGLAIAAIVLVVGLLVLTGWRRTSRGKLPTKTPYVDAWTEAGKRAPAQPSASDVLDGDGDDDDH